ncbi:nuclear transport factor 2 family protein [Myxococcus sp. 1LA]
MSELKLSEPSSASLQRWHAMVARKDLSGVTELFDPEVVFLSPVAHRPYRTGPVVSTILNTVLTIFEDFTYHRQLVSPDGLSVVLEFSARVGKRELKGIDFIRFNEQGKIVEFEVMIRPMTGLSALAEEMGRRLANDLTAAPTT